MLQRILSCLLGFMLAFAGSWVGLRVPCLLYGQPILHPNLLLLLELCWGAFGILAGLLV